MIDSILYPIEDELMNNLYEQKETILHRVFRFEADEMWSFVGNKKNKQWIWLVMNTENRQIVAFHVGGPGQEDAQLLFKNTSSTSNKCCVFY